MLVLDRLSGRLNAERPAAMLRHRRGVPSGLVVGESSCLGIFGDEGLGKVPARVNHVEDSQSEEDHDCIQDHEEGLVAYDRSAPPFHELNRSVDGSDEDQKSRSGHSSNEDLAVLDVGVRDFRLVDGNDISGLAESEGLDRASGEEVVDGVDEEGRVQDHYAHLYYDSCNHDLGTVVGFRAGFSAL